MRSGLTSYRSLLVPQLFEHASVQSAAAEIVSASTTGVRRLTFHQLHHRVRQLASALAAIGVRQGDRVASLAGNDHRHVELFFAVTSLGAALHAIDSQLSTEAVRTAILAAGDRLVCFSASNEAQASRFGELRSHVLAMISMTENGTLGGGRDVLNYERLLAEHQDERDWAFTDENAVASLAAARNDPQRILTQTHRMTALHAVAACADDVVALAERDNVLLAVPLVVPGTWSLVCAVAISGANLVLAGADMDPSQLFELMRAEQITLVLASPDLWGAMLDLVDAARTDLTQIHSLRRAIACGGPVPASMQARLVHAFGPDVAAIWSLPLDEGGSSPFGAEHDSPGTASPTPGDHDEPRVNRS